MNVITRLGLMQFVNTAEVRLGNLSLGASLEIDYQSLDVGQEESLLGVQVVK